ncbi:MAG: SPFH domain-containing protein [Acidobacteria bacterium]|nr:MAG: SPFH domain-containing protein [Acidobacteriota bacterium]
MLREIEHRAPSGIGVFALLFAVLLALAFAEYAQVRALVLAGGPPSQARIWMLIVTALAGALDVLLMTGVFPVHPNEGCVLQFFGKYVGTAKEPGLRWANPFYSKKRVSLRVRNFETSRLKVNDNRGNPIEIAAVVVWQVVDTAEAVFMVDDYENYVHVQSEAALRNLAQAYPYDVFEEGETSLVSHTAEISERLREEIQERLAKAGVRVIEARISHLAYAPEIAGAMLQRQQAAAVIAARRKIVEGAVGMVENALEMLSRQKVLELDEERKANMVSNLLVVLCADTRPQPVINAGTLY